MSNNITHKTLHWVQGNTVNLAIPLQQETQTQSGKIVEDYYPSQDDVVSVFACGKYLSTQLECVVNDNVVVAKDNGNLKVGVYGIEIRITKADGTRLRSMWNSQVEIHKTNDGVITQWNDFLAPDSQLLDAVIFFFAKGNPGEGVPEGGTTGQVLKKKSNDDYDTEWSSDNAPVTSVNGKKGEVTLGAEDVGALPVDTPIPTVPTDVSSFNNDAGYITKSVNDLANYYLKYETYTKQEVQGLIAAIQQFHYEIYASTSDVTTPQGNVLYLIGPTGTGDDKYEEYVYANSQFVKIGDTSIDLSGYYTSQQTDSAITQALNTALAGYTTTAALTLLLAGKEDVTTIVAPANESDATLPVTSLTCEIGKYYRLDVPVETLAVTLPAMGVVTSVKTVVIYLSGGTTPAVTITSADSKDVYYQDGYELEAGKTYEVNALFNGSAWIIASVEIIIPEEEEE